MVNPQLLQYVRAQKAAGVSKEDIVKALSGGGWTAQDAQEAFAAIDAPPPVLAQKPPPPPPQMPAQTPQMATMSPVMQARTMPAQAAMAQQPMTVRPQVVQTMQPRVSSATYTAQPRRRSRWPWVLLGLIIFFILGFGAGAYAAVKYDF